MLPLSTMVKNCYHLPKLVSDSKSETWANQSLIKSSKWNKISTHASILQISATLRGSLTFELNIVIIHFREKCSKQNMKKTFRENVIVCEDFSLNCKENELHKKFWFLGGLRKRTRIPNFRDRTKWMVPLDLAGLRV